MVLDASQTFSKGCRLYNLYNPCTYLLYMIQYITKHVYALHMYPHSSTFIQSGAIYCQYLTLNNTATNIYAIVYFRKRQD